MQNNNFLLKGVAMKKEICEKCKNYVQHYSYSKFGISKMNCGHCFKRQMSKKECTMFKEKETTCENEISVFDEIIKYQLMFKSVIFKIETLTSSLEKIQSNVKLLIKEKK